MTTPLRKRLTRLDIIVAVCVACAVLLLVLSSMSFYSGVAAAEEARSLPYAGEPLEGVGFALGALLLMAALAVWIRGAWMETRASGQIDRPRYVWHAGPKIGIVLAGTLLVVTVGVGLSAVSFALGYAVACALTVILVVTAARLFRSADEPPTGRKWWHMTGGPATGFLLAALFLFQAMTTAVALIAGEAPAVVWLGVLAGLLIGAAYLHSAIRLSRTSVRRG